MSLHLMCHETIPGTDYKRGDSITDEATIKEILSNAGLAKNFSQVPDGTFANAPAQKTFQAAPAPQQVVQKPAETASNPAN